MSTVTLPETTYVRRLVEERGGFPNQLTVAQINAVLERCGDPDLAATALTMKPRPNWVTVLVPGGKGLRG